MALGAKQIEPGARRADDPALLVERDQAVKQAILTRQARADVVQAQP